MAGNQKQTMNKKNKRPRGMAAASKKTRSRVGKLGGNAFHKRRGPKIGTRQNRKPKYETTEMG